MSTKVKNSKMEATRVIMTPLGSAGIECIQYVEYVVFPCV